MHRLLTAPSTARRGVPWALGIVLVALLALPACRHTASSGSNKEPARATITIDNRNFLDMTVYVLRAGQRSRLGRVSGKSTETFVLPRSLLGGPATLRFLADPLGSNAQAVSQEIFVAPGDEVEMVIPI